MSSAGDPDIVTGTRSRARLSAVPAPREQRDDRDPRVLMDAEDVVTLPLAGQPGPGRTASLRRQLVWVAEEGQARDTGVYEVICRACGDHPYWEYAEIPPRLQRIRGPYALEAGLAAYAEHLGLAPGLHVAWPGRPGAGDAMTGPADPDTVPGTRPAARRGAVPAAPGPRDSRDPWDAEGAMTLPRAGQPGHGRTASLRRRPVRIADGRMEGGYTDVFEVICPGCGDHQYLDYSEVSPRLQRIRGPYTMGEGLEVYAEHLGLVPAPQGQGQATGSSNGRPAIP